MTNRTTQGSNLSYDSVLTSFLLKKGKIIHQELPDIVTETHIIHIRRFSSHKDRLMISRLVRLWNRYESVCNQSNSSSLITQWIYETQRIV
jgi:hypothetical protein